MGIGSLRQGAQRFTENNNSGKGGGGKGGFFNKLRIPTLSDDLRKVLYNNEQPGEPIMLVKPENLYDDVYNVDQQGNWTGAKEAALHVVTHQVQTVMNGKPKYDDFPCTAGANPHAPQHCVGCQQNDSGNKSVGNGRQQWVFNVKHLVAYHEIPLLDRKTNQIVYKKEKPSEPVLILQQCWNSTPAERLYRMKNGQIQQCEYCQKGIPQTYGAPKVYVLGKNHLDELLRVDNHLEQTCANCMTRLIKTAFVCGQCGNDLLDLANAQLINDQIKQYAETPQRCNCGHVALPVPTYDCGFDPNGMYKVPNGCPESVTPRPLSIFDCVFYVHREGKDTQSKLVVSPPVPIQHFRTITGQADLIQWLKSPQLARTFNLLDMFKPRTLDDQAKICGVQNPYQAQAPQHQQYPGQPQQQGFAPGQYGAPQPQQYGAPQQPPQAPQYGVQQPGFPPQPGFPQQQPQWQQPAQPQYPQPNVPFSGRPDFGKQ